MVVKSKGTPLEMPLIQVYSRNYSNLSGFMHHHMGQLVHIPTQRYEPQDMHNFRVSR